MSGEFGHYTVAEVDDLVLLLRAVTLVATDAKLTLSGLRDSVRLPTAAEVPPAFRDPPECLGDVRRISGEE